MNEYAYADAVAKAIDRLDVRLRAVEQRDRFDVEAMVDKACNAERAARQRHIEDVARDLRAELRCEVMELREEVGELVANIHATIEGERRERMQQDGAVMNVLHARTADRV